MKKVILTSVMLLLASNCFAEGNPYLELRYSLFSNKPSVIGNSECPCYGSEIIAGYKYSYKKVSFDFSNSWVYHTRWDDPEISKSNLQIAYKQTQHFTWLSGYEVTHNLDRPAVIPYNSQIEYNGVKEIESKEDYYGISGLHYLWVGFRIGL